MPINLNTMIIIGLCIFCVIFCLVMKNSKKKQNIFIENLNAITFIIIGVVFVSITVPLILEFFIYRNDYKTMLNNAEWASFLGSFLGGTIGGGITLIAMYISIKATRKDLEHSEKIKNRSYIDIFIEESESGTFVECKELYLRGKILWDEDYEYLMNNTQIIYKNRGLKFIGIENVGPGVMKEFKIKFIDSGQREKEVSLHRILVGEIIFIPILFGRNKEINSKIKSIEIYCRTLSNEVLNISKVFHENLSYEESIKYIEKMNYGYKREIIHLKDINLF